MEAEKYTREDVRLTIGYGELISYQYDDSGEEDVEGDSFEIKDQEGATWTIYCDMTWGGNLPDAQDVLDHAVAMTCEGRSKEEAPEVTDDCFIILACDGEIETETYFGTAHEAIDQAEFQWKEMAPEERKAYLDEDGKYMVIDKDGNVLWDASKI